MADQTPPAMLNVNVYPTQPAGSAWIGNSSQALQINSNIATDIKITITTPSGNLTTLPIVGIAAPVQPNGGLATNFGAVFANVQPGPTIASSQTTTLLQTAPSIGNWVVAVLPATTIPASGATLPSSLGAAWENFSLTGDMTSGFTAIMSTGSTSVTIMIDMGTGATR